MKYGNKYIMYDLARWARKEIRRALAKGLLVQIGNCFLDGSGREFDLPTSKLEIVHFKIKTLISTIYIQCMLASVCFSHSKEGPC